MTSAPVQLALLARARRRHPGEPVVLLRQKVAPRVLLALVLAEIALAAAAFAVTAPVAAFLRSVGFAWWTTAWALDRGAHPGFGRPALLVTARLVLLGSVVVAPVVEEHCFRGYLLPRMPARLRPSTVLAHAGLPPLDALAAADPGSWRSCPSFTSRDGLRTCGSGSSPTWSSTRSTSSSAPGSYSAPDRRR
jgi:hypothetical protein